MSRNTVVWSSTLREEEALRRAVFRLARFLEDQRQREFIVYCANDLDQGYYRVRIRVHHYLDDVVLVPESTWIPSVRPQEDIPYLEVRVESEAEYPDLEGVVDPDLAGLPALVGPADLDLEGLPALEPVGPEQWWWTSRISQLVERLAIAEEESEEEDFVDR